MKNNYTFLSLFMLLFTSSALFAQNGLCSEIEPLCLTNNTVIFPNCFNGDGDCVPAAEAGPDYDCLGSTPFPTWQFIDVSQSGDLVFEISQNTSFDGNENPSGNLLDVDFIVWGPFGENDELCDYDNLQDANLIDCSFSPAAVEVISIPNAVAGERYVLLITNFNQQQGFIKIEQTGGDGATVCTLSVSEETFVDLEVYPNPIQDIVNIRSSSFTQETSATLYSVDGKRIAIYTSDVSGQTIRIDLSTMATGIYFVQIQSGEKQVTKQLIKK